MHVFRVEIGVALDESGLYRVQNDQQGEILDLRLVRRARSFDLYNFFRVFDLEQNLPESISIYVCIYIYIYIPI